MVFVVRRILYSRPLVHPCNKPLYVAVTQSLICRGGRQDGALINATTLRCWVMGFDGRLSCLLKWWEVETKMVEVWKVVEEGEKGFSGFGECFHVTSNGQVAAVLCGFYLFRLFLTSSKTNVFKRNNIQVSVVDL